MVGTVTGGAVWDVISANGADLDPAADQNTGIVNLIARPPAMAKSATITVRWRLAGTADPAGPLLGAISTWPQAPA